MKNTEKDKWDEMNGSQRWQYFKDYYLFITVVVIVLVGIAAFLCWHFWKPKAEHVLYVAVMDDSLDEEDIKKLQGQLEQLYHVDGKQKKVMIDDNFYTREDGITKLEVYLRNEQVDVIIADKEVFQQLAGYGFLQDMNTVMDHEIFETYEEDLYYAAGYRDTKGVSFEDRETGQGEVLPYGVDISGSVFQETGSIQEEPILGIAAGAPNLGNGVDFIKFLFE
ncbi:MAG TPA: hypothetical protein IAC62_08405 [Candidatus Pelethocola excrementipullorum]|nr:hypothetical protein [Candidatus Pelethocola excrementipullorum]